MYMNVCANGYDAVALPPSYAGTNQIRYKGQHHKDALSAGRKSSSPGAYGIVGTFLAHPIIANGMAMSTSIFLRRLVNVPKHH
jgi:hypothetical protein